MVIRSFKGEVPSFNQTETFLRHSRLVVFMAFANIKDSHRSSPVLWLFLKWEYIQNECKLKDENEKKESLELISKEDI